MTILTNGHVGIGTIDPHYALQVVGNVVDSGTFYANNIECGNRISVGQFQMVAGVVDSIVSSSGTIATTATIKAGGFQSSYFQTDSIQVSQINPIDSVIYFGDPSMSLTLPKVSAYALVNNVSMASLCAGPERWNSACGYSFNSTATPSCPRFGLGTTDLQAELDIENTPTGIPALLVGNGKVVIGSGLNLVGPYGLYVGSGILTSIVKVATVNSGNWSDYVFANKYKLKTLTEVAHYIKTNKHLPDVPSAEDVQKDGLDLAQMDATLLKKIEELTLYMIQQQKQSEQQQKEIQDLKSQLARLQSGQTK